ncbi:unnamed protein product [Rotaria magnacalcarata]|uniref:BZIP domain-containing protein n=8 Tax=Rotaria magnacalcarata TaxID=392030 RepID=A0A816H7R8_9BILA|nr:unnamed protein product [Rotaria magnacalcarata]CAF1684081.1 unnamed protein product [Rotaria magnacalcarata]CAF2052911.1 unnamed protein product [Rotaria magnacalcarata]
MERRNVVFSVVQDRSKIQTFTPTLFKMSNQQQTAEKSVQTQDLSSSPTVLVSNNSVTHIHTENTAAEVANTLVSMATGRQRATTTVKQLNVISVPSPTTLPILALSDYTTPRGVPTAMSLANQAKLTPTKHNEMLVGDEDDDDTSMSTDEYNQSQNDSKPRTKSTRGKSNKSISTSKNHRQQTVEPIQYGPIVVKPRKSIAPTLANGRKSKDEQLPPDEDVKRRQRRDRNKQAAAKCRRKRNDLREELEKVEEQLLEQQKSLERTVQTLNDQKNQLEILLHRHPCTKKVRLPMATTSTPMHTLNITKSDIKTIPTTTLLDSNNNSGNSKRVTINFTNAQDLLAIAPLTRITPTLTTDGSSSSNVPMITIHIIPEVAQALLGSTSVDKVKLAELIQQANANNASSTTISDSTATNTSMNSTS